MEGSKNLTVKECPFCKGTPFSLNISIRGQIFCRCGAELRSGLDMESGLFERVVQLIEQWNTRIEGKGKGTVCMREVEPCPCCGSNRISLLSDHSGLKCQCGLRFKPSSDKMLSVADLITLWNTRGESDD